MESILKNDRVLNMLLMFEQGIRGEICQAMLRYATANIICMKNYNKNVASSLLQHLDANNLYGWAMSKSCLLVNLIGYIQKIIQKTS